MPSFPMPWSDFAGLMPIRSAPWRLRRFEQISWSGGSVPGVSELADPRWSCRVTLDILSLAEARGLQMLFDLHGSGQPFLLHDPMRPTPAADPTGSILGAATPTVASVSAGRVSVAGLPAGYVLTRGDRITLQHGAAGLAMYGIAETATANGSGLTPLLTLVPPARSIAAPGQAVTLIRPVATMLILPDSYDPGQHLGGTVRDMAFDAVEAW